ncbi:hypothetical protein [Comamonas testosteroni]|jgi:hypothetical protein|uniref:hypothetical protein n=1 Tax=Comamonas testosteroni TaxID=285 RepID=UPI0026F03243|nr:hypothetical protein [Comamonas testosteroni]
MTHFKDLPLGAQFMLPDSGMAMERGAIFQKRTSKTYDQVFPEDVFLGMEIKPRTLELKVEEVSGQI